MTERIIDNELRLIPYYRNDEASLPWYQDLDVCKQVDNREEPYDVELLHRMYDYLTAHGDCYYIEYKGVLVGDVRGAKTSTLTLPLFKAARTAVSPEAVLPAFCANPKANVTLLPAMFEILQQLLEYILTDRLFQSALQTFLLYGLGNAFLIGADICAASVLLAGKVKTDLALRRTYNAQQSLFILHFIAA